jgi:translation initiation factor 2 gamma subunit (eIF-2gamma)
MEKTREKVRKIIKESFEANMKIISWNGMHDVVIDKIMEIIKKKVKISENKS